MGLIDKVKGVTGLGLNPDEAYRRAYEKGVLLAKYDAASDLFAKAAEKYEAASHAEQANRSRANQFLYSYLLSRDPSFIDRILPHLRQIEWIEDIGSQADRIRAAELVLELEARKLEDAAFASQNEPALAHVLHTNTAQKFHGLLRAPLRTYSLIPAAIGTESAEERYFLHQGYSSFHQALDIQHRDPIAASERLREAVMGFRRAKQREKGGIGEIAEGLLAKLRLIRNCWFCHREVQGLGLHIDYYPASIAPYLRALVEKMGQDATTLSSDNRAIAVCGPCASMIQFQAERYAQAQVDLLRQ